MDITYQNIEDGIKDNLKMAGCNLPPYVLAVLTELTIMHCYSSSESFRLLYAPKFLEGVQNYIYTMHTRDKATFQPI